MENKIIVTKHDEVYLRLDCEEHITKELVDYFSFIVKGARFSPAFRSGKWNGKIYLFSQKTKLLYAGLYEKLEKFCKKNNYELEYLYDNFDEEFSLKEANDFFDSLGLPSRIERRPYQIEALVHAIRKRRVTLLSSTASGKSFIIYMLTRYLLKRTLIIVPRVDLVSQLYDDFKDYGFDSSKFIQRIYSGKSSNVNKPIVVTTWQSIYQKDKSWFDDFDVVILDEAHGMTDSKSLKAIMENMPNCKYRIGLTGSLEESKIHSMVVEGLFGPIRVITTTAKQIEEGYAPPLEINCIILKYDPSLIKDLGFMDYDQERNFLYNNEPRNRFIQNLALSLKGNTLILFRSLDHGKKLFSMIQKESKSKTFYIAGEIDTDYRNDVRHIIDLETESITVASLGVWSVGTNIPNLHNIIFASPSKSYVTTLQTIGRSLRKTLTKTKATIYDISDNLCQDGFENITFKHLAERLRIYKKEKFDFKIYRVQLKMGEHVIQSDIKK